MLFSMVGWGGISFAEEFNPYNSGSMNIPEAIFTPTKPDTSGTPIEPTEIFKGVYFIGTTWVGCMLYKTKGGIIMWDAMNNTDDMINILEPDMATLGLDPADIKIVMISHGHGDHYGGAKYLQDTYGAEVYMSVDNIPTMNAPNRDGSPKNPATLPILDGYLADGDVITFGGLTFEFAATPGHTPGSMSFVVPVTALDDGTEHKPCNWGGTNYPRDLAGMLDYKDSVAYFSDFIAERNVDVEFSIHPFVDQSVQKLEKVRETGSSDAFIYGEETVQFFFDCLDNAVTQKINAVE